METTAVVGSILRNTIGSPASPWWSNLSSIATFVAIVVGAVWSWKRFDLGRENKPRCNLSVTVMETPLPGEGTALE